MYGVVERVEPEDEEYNHSGDGKSGNYAHENDVVLDGRNEPTTCGRFQHTSIRLGDSHLQGVFLAFVEEE